MHARAQSAPVATEEDAPAAVRAAPSVTTGLADTLARARHASPRQRGATLASLQRSVGNRAIARYEAGEHAQFGGPGKTLKVGTVDITEAELAAMGDFYKSPEAMVADAKANAKAFEALRDKIRQDRTLRMAGKAGLPEKDWIAGTAHRPKGETYLELAAHNITHFAPGKGPEDHRNSWEAIHKQALEAAQAAKKVTNEASMLNGFAAHFLTDAFAAGHLVAKPETMAQAGKNFDAMATTGWLAKENDFSKGLARGLLADKTVAAELANWELKVATWGEFTPERLSEVIFGMRKEAPDEFLSLFARIVHDQLDDAIKAGKGLEVTNLHGDIWTLSGDETLHLSTDTQYVAGQAVEASRQNLATAASGGKLDLPQLFSNVWKFVPRPTTKAEHDTAVKEAAATTFSTTILLAPGASAGEEQLKGTVTTFTDPSRTETVDAIVKLAAGKLDAVIDQLQSKGYARRKAKKKP